MLVKKKIPCRQCGKLFVPCSYCQTHADVFRWRNFTCSLDCAKTYISNTIEYRESQRGKSEKSKLEILRPQKTVEETLGAKSTVPTRKNHKNKATEEIVDNEIENNETE